MRRPVLASYLLGALMLSALVGVVVQFGEIEQFIALARRLQPGWLLLCLALQSATYLCETIAWEILLRHLGYRIGILRLLPLSVGKLFADQAMPSAGLSGNAFFLRALRRRGVPRVPALSCVLAALSAYFAAYASLSAIALLVLERHDPVYRWLLVPGALIITLQAAVPLGLWQAGHGRHLPCATLFRVHPWLGIRIEALQAAAKAMPRQFILSAQVVLLHAGVMLLDAATLWTMLGALGLHPAFAPVFSGFVVASVVMSASPVPLGLGTFEASCVAMLHGIGIGLEAGLTATLLLRGMTTWLPMVPGLWLIRGEIRN